MSCELWAETTLELSHTLQEPVGVPTMHGHSYWVRVYVETDWIEPTPLPKLQEAMQRIQKYDHTHMNTWLLDPTMERLAEFVAGQVVGVRVTRVQVERKSLGTGVEYRPV